MRWIKIIKVYKTLGSDNCSDIFTTYVKADILQQHVEKVGIDHGISSKSPRDYISNVDLGGMPQRRQVIENIMNTAD